MGRAHPGELGGHDTGGHGDDAIPDQHEQDRQRTAEGRGRGEVAVAHRGERHDGPVHADRNAGEAVALALDHVHERAHDDDDGHHGEQEDGDLPLAGAERLSQHLRLPQVLGELEHPEDPQQPEQADDEEALRTGSQQTQVAGEDRQQVDHAEGAPGVAPRLAHGGEPEPVLDREQGGKDPLESAELGAVPRSNAGHTLEHDHGHAGQDHDQQGQVEEAPGLRVGLEDDLVYSAPKRGRRSRRGLHGP
jgi:hypothetical protein